MYYTPTLSEKHPAVILFYPAFNIPELVSKFSRYGNMGDWGNMGSMMGAAADCASP